MPLPLLALLLPAFAPVVADGLRAVFNRVTGGAGIRPTNVDEAVKLWEAEAKWSASMAQLDQPAPNISRWVADLRASFRYIAAGLFVLSPFVMLLVINLGGTVPPEILEMSSEASKGAFSFIFGDRMYAYLRNQ